MASPINTTGLSEVVEHINASSEIISETIFTNPELSANHSFYTGLTVKKKFPIASRGGNMISTAPGCDPTPDSDISFNVNSEKTFDPVEVGFRMKLCYSDFEGVFKKWLASGNDKPDVLVSEFSAWMMGYFEENLPHELWRMFWFCDTEANWTGGSPAGNISTAGAVKYYTMFDGFFKQLIAQATSNASQRVTIAANTSSTQVLGTTEVFNAFNDMLDQASIRLMANRGALRFYVTDSVNRALRKYLRTQTLDNSFDLITQDQGSLAFDGIPLVVIPEWDITIERDFTVAGVKYLPHRIVLTYPENLAAGTQEEANLVDMDAFYEKKDRAVYIDLAANADAKVLLDEEFVIAY